MNYIQCPSTIQFVYYYVTYIHSNILTCINWLQTSMPTLKLTHVLVQCVYTWLCLGIGYPKTPLFICLS